MTTLSMTCSGAHATCATRRATPGKRPAGTRLLTVVLALLAVVLVVNGARYVLQQSPAAANELVVARSVMKAIDADAYGQLDAVPGECVATR